MELRLELRTPADGLSGLMPESLLAAARDALASELSAVAQDARTLCPVQSGRLRESIGVRMQEEGASGEVVANAPYAAIVEMGSAARAARPFLYPAFMARRTELAGRVAGAALRRAGSGGKQ